MGLVTYLEGIFRGPRQTGWTIVFREVCSGPNRVDVPEEGRGGHSLKREVGD